MSSPFRHAVLPNGLTIIGEIEPTAQTAAVGFFVKTGARDEMPEQMGVSHFLEHMMFKGTERRSAEAVDRDFDDIGANHNAFTTSEMTAFYAHCLPEYLPRAEEVLSDIMRPSIRPGDLEDERKVILEEIAMYQDQPLWRLYDRAMEEYYGSHPLAHRVLGTAETVSALPHADMVGYFNHRYSADNTVVALAGRVDFEEMVARLAEHCGAWPRTGARRDPARPATLARRFEMQIPTINRTYILILAPAPALGDDRRYAATILSQLLGDDDGSRLYWALIETGLAEEAQSQFDGRDGVGEYFTFCACSPEDASQVEEVVRREIRTLLDNTTTDDLARVRARMATAITLASELPGGRMRRLGKLWTYFAEWRSLEEELARLERVSLEELREVASAYPMEPRLTGILRPGEA